MKVAKQSNKSDTAFNQGNVTANQPITITITSSLYNNILCKHFFYYCFRSLLRLRSNPGQLLGQRKNVLRSSCHSQSTLSLLRPETNFLKAYKVKILRLQPYKTVSHHLFQQDISIFANVSLRAPFTPQEPENVLFYH